MVISPVTPDFNIIIHINSLYLSFTVLKSNLNLLGFDVWITEGEFFPKVPSYPASSFPKASPPSLVSWPTPL